jgi:hypothetical protein
MSRSHLVTLVGIACLLSAGAAYAQQDQPAVSGSASGASAVAAVPRLIKYSGEVRDARGEPLGSVAVRLNFAVYEEQLGGAALWAENQVVELDEQGQYSVLLGATRADGLPVELFPAGKARWLGVQVEGTDEDPRVLLVSVPYALKSEDAAKLGGRSASDFVLAEQLKEEVRTQVEAQKPGITAQAVETLVNNPPNLPAITEGPSTFTCATTGDCVAVTQSGTGRALRATATSGSEAALLQQNGTGYGLRVLSQSNYAIYGVVQGAVVGTTYGVRGLVNSTTGAGILGSNTATTGIAYGLMGLTSSVSGMGLYGRALSTTGTTFGLTGDADSTSGKGIMGRATATSGTTMGIYGEARSASGTALVVNNTASGKLVSGQANSVEKFSVSGSGNVTATSFSGNGAGLTNLDASDLVGVISTTSSVVGVPGVAGTNTAAGRGVSGSGDVGVYGTGTTYGVQGESADTGVYGHASAGTGDTNGVYGLADSTAGTGVYGHASAATGDTSGVYGLAGSTDGVGVFGYASSATGLTDGVYGEAASTDGAGMYGYAGAVSGETYGLYGEAESTSGTGVMGYALSTTGTTVGVTGETASAAGVAGLFDNLAGGKILIGQTNGTERFRVDGSGNVVAGGTLGGTQLISTVASGTAPLSVTSNTLVPSLNADLLDGVHASAFQLAGTYAALGANTFTGTQTISTGDLSVAAGNVVASGSISTATGLISGAGGSYSGTTADQIVSVLQSGTGSGLTGTTLGIAAASAGVNGLATSNPPGPEYSHASGVYGFSAGYYGTGILGEASGLGGVGVKGVVTYAAGAPVGVQGVTGSTNSGSAGVYGQSTAATGQARGVSGTAASADGYGVFGYNSASGVGLMGSSAGIGVQGRGQPGVKGISEQDSQTGVNGQTRYGIGVLGEATSIGYYVGTGVKGTAATSQDGTTGVFGYTTSLSGATIGVHAKSDGSNGIGVLAEVTGNAFTTYAIKATAQSPFGAVISAVGSNGSAGLYVETDTDIAGDFNRTAGFDTDPILLARSGSTNKFKVRGDGNVYAAGTFTGGGADFAEAMSVRGERDQYEPGDVLVIDPSGDRQLTLANQAYSTHVAGIYSTKPGMLGKPYSMDDPRGAKDIPLAVVGIVPCKVSAENGPIGRGDLLVASSTPGHAMKGTDRAQMLGAIVGKALEPLPGGTGVIQVLVTLQ